MITHQRGRIKTGWELIAALGIKAQVALVQQISKAHAAPVAMLDTEEVGPGRQWIPCRYSCGLAVGGGTPFRPDLQPKKQDEAPCQPSTKTSFSTQQNWDSSCLRRIDLLPTLLTSHNSISGNITSQRLLAMPGALNARSSQSCCDIRRHAHKLPYGGMSRHSPRDHRVRLDAVDIVVDTARMIVDGNGKRT